MVILYFLHVPTLKILFKLFSNLIVNLTNIYINTLITNCNFLKIKKFKFFDLKDVNMDLEIKDKVALIIGASKNIGKSIALKLAEECGLCV